MRIPSRTCRRNGFTLVELLVVMGIIAILVGVILAGVSSAIKYAKRTRANATCMQIQTAMQNYNTEYGVYPTAGTGTGDDYYPGTASGSWPKLMYTLCGNVNPLGGGAGPTTGISATANSRSIAYIQPTRSELDTTSGTPGALANPFGLTMTGPYYFMVVDTDYSGVAGDTGSGTAALLDFSSSTGKVQALGHGVPGGVAVWCSCDQSATAPTGTMAAFWAHSY